MKTTVLGLYLSQQTAQAVVIERNTSHCTLLALHEWNNTLFDYAGDDTPGVDEFVEHLSDFTRVAPAQPQHATVALDTSLLFMNTIPFDHPATQKTIREQVEWELNQYFPGSPRNAFITDIHVLARRESSPYEDVLAVSVRRDVVQKLHRSLGKVKLPLEIVDADHFSADRALHINHPGIANKHVVLVGSKADRMDVSIIRNNELVSYSYHRTDLSEQVVEYIADISKNINRLDFITIFGTNLDNKLLARVRNMSAVPVEALNPFLNIDIASSVRYAHDPTTDPFRFAAAIGVALRED